MESHEHSEPQEHYPKWSIEPPETPCNLLNSDVPPFSKRAQSEAISEIRYRQYPNRIKQNPTGVARFEGAHPPVVVDQSWAISAGLR